jgi:hypothetical protein
MSPFGLQRDHEVDACGALSRQVARYERGEKQGHQATNTALSCRSHSSPTEAFRIRPMAAV